MDIAVILQINDPCAHNHLRDNIMARNRSLPAELRAAEKKFGKFESLDLLIPDLSGILKGKRIRPGDFEKACEGGFVFCAGATMLTGLGDVVSGVPYGADDGDPDLPAELVPGSIVPVPWSNKPMGQAFFRMKAEDGGNFFGDPRTVLENALKPLRAGGKKIVVATELEFYLLDWLTLGLFNQVEFRHSNFEIDSDGDGRPPRDGEPIEDVVSFQNAGYFHNDIFFRITARY